MRPTPLFTVAIVTRNHAQYIAKTIASCLVNELPAFEILVVDDGSDDDTGEVVRALITRIPQLRYVRLAKVGLVAARNVSLQHARGDYLVCLDSDDALMPRVLDQYHRHLQANPFADVMFGNLIVCDASLNPVSEARHQALPPYPQTAQLLFSGNRVAHPGTAARTALMRTVGGYRPEAGGACDYALWLELAIARARFSYLPISVARYRRHGSNMSTTMGRIAQWERGVIESAVSRFSDRELLPALDWSHPESATVGAVIMIATRMLHTGSAPETIRAAMLSRLTEPALARTVGTL